MQPDQARAVLNFYLSLLENEHETTRRVLAAIPAGKEEYRPDPVSKTAVQLAAHIAESEIWFLTGVSRGEFPEYGKRNSEPPKTAAEVLARYECEYPKALAPVKQMTPDQAAKPVSMFARLELPAVAFISVMVRHSAHHRGQLSAYLRPMGAKVPAIYGESADSKSQQAGA